MRPTNSSLLKVVVFSAALTTEPRLRVVVHECIQSFYLWGDGKPAIDAPGLQWT